MPILTMLVGVVIGAVGKTLVDSLWTTECWQRYHVRQNLTQTEPIKLEDVDLIPFNSLVNDRICKRLANDEYGIFLLAAPIGSGKSSFMKMALKKLRSQFQYITLLKCGGSSVLTRNMNELLKVPKGHALSDYLPEGTLLIVDQLDKINENLTVLEKNFLTELAADSVNSKQFKVVMCVSDPDTAKTILKCNGGEKFQLLCPCASLVWSDDQLSDFIGRKLPQQIEADSTRLKALAKTCSNSPGLIVRAKALAAMEANDILSADSWDLLEDYAEMRATAWKKFMEEVASRKKKKKKNEKVQTVVTTDE